MTQTVHVPLPVQGPLDTVSPLSNRPPGTLLDATDAHLQYCGARSGLTQKSWVFRAAAFPDPDLPVFDGTNSFGSATMCVKPQMNLGTKWTLDIVLRPELVSHSADAMVPVFQWRVDSINFITVNILAGGSAAGDQRKLRVLVIPTSAPGVAGSTTTLTGTTQMTVGLQIEKTHHIRVVRDRATINVYLDGILEATSAAFSSTQRHEGGTASSVTGTVYLGAAAGLAAAGNHFYSGRIMRTCLRAGAATDVTKGMRDFMFGKSAGVHFLQHGRNFRGYSPQVERSIYQAEWTWTSMNFEDVTQPAPWFSTPVQAGAYFVDSYGRGWNAVLCGGAIYARRVG